MPKQHKAIQTRGHRNPSAAQINVGTGSTFGGVAGIASESTDAGYFADEEIVTTPAPPVVVDENSAPLTVGHLLRGWRVLTVFFSIAVFIAVSAWRLSQLTSEVEQHEGDLKEIKTKTENLANDSAVTSAKLQKIDSQVERLEDKLYEQIQSRTKK